MDTTDIVSYVVMNARQQETLVVFLTTKEKGKWLGFGRKLQCLDVSQLCVYRDAVVFVRLSAVAAATAAARKNEGGLRGLVDHCIVL